MLAGAIQQWLKAQGMTRVLVGGFGDYSETGTPAVAVHAEPDANVEMDSGTYSARLQLRTRAANAIAAENLGRTALDHVLAADGEALAFTDPTGEQDRTYRLEAIAIVNRPTWYPTPEPGEETSCNLRAMVTET